jgi:hypothetical protein
VIEFILVQAMLQDLANGTVYQQTKTEILQTINDQATSTVHSEATTIGVQTLIPPPSPPSPIAGVSSSDFKVGIKQYMYYTKLVDQAATPL